MVSLVLGSRSYHRHAVAILGVLLVSGCAAPQQAGQGSQAAAAGCSNKTSTTVEGAAAGGLLGSVVGLAAGHSAKAALIGGVGGAALGTVAGIAVANNNCNQAVSEQNLNQEIARAQAQAAQYQNDAVAYDGRTAEAQKSIAALQSEYRHGKLSAANYHARMEAYRAIQTSLHDELNQLQAGQQTLQQEAQQAASNGGELTREAQQEASTQQDLKNDYTALTNSLAAVPST